jgi:SAM-dependent methyltransferase
MEYAAARALAESLLGTAYRQCNSWDDAHEYELRVSKKGKPFFSEKQATRQPKEQTEQNRAKNYLLSDGMRIPALVDMGVMTESGSFVHAMYDKFRQINRLVELIDDGVSRLQQSDINVIDFGCGKSYLTFVLYHYLTEIKHMRVHMVGLDLKADVIAHCNRCSEKYGCEGLSFEQGDIGGYRCDFPVDMVISLHACDTATDFALHQAVQWNAKLIYAAPCCQHELNAQMQSNGLSLLTRYGIAKERTAALLTDTIRANLLTYSGYDTQLLEFIDMEHTPKNLLIRSRKAALSERTRQNALDEVRRAMEEFSLRPSLYKLMGIGD